MPDQDKKNLDRLKEKTARLSIISNTGLVILKFVVGMAIGILSATVPMYLAEVSPKVFIS